MNDETILEIKESVEDTPLVFTVDSKEYEIHDFRYLTDSQEIEFEKLRARDRRWNKQVNELTATLDNTTDDTKAEKLEDQIDTLKARIAELRGIYLSMLTNMPVDVADKLRLWDKQRLIDSITEISNAKMKKPVKEGEKADADSDPKTDETGSGSTTVPNLV